MKENTELQDLMKRAAGFQEGRILLSAVELDLFTVIGNGATTGEAAEKLGADRRGTGILMNALGAIGLLIKEEGVFRCSPLAARHLVEGSPEDARAGLMHYSNLWQSWSGLTDCVLKGEPAESREINDRGGEWTEPFIALMHLNAAARAPLVVKELDLEGVRRVLDVGGGSGAYSMAFAKAGDFDVDLFDLPAISPIARRRIEEADLSDRVRVIEGDLSKDEFGEGYDLIFISAVCHIFGPPEITELFRKARRALLPGGRIVVQDFILDPGGISPLHSAVFAVNMLTGTKTGGTYSEAEYVSWLLEAGFGEARRVELPGPADLVLAIRR